MSKHNAKIVITIKNIQSILVDHGVVSPDLDSLDKNKLYVFAFKTKMHQTH